MGPATPVWPPPPLKRSLRLQGVKLNDMYASNPPEERCELAELQAEVVQLMLDGGDADEGERLLTEVIERLRSLLDSPLASPAALAPARLKLVDLCSASLKRGHETRGVDLARVAVAEVVRAMAGGSLAARDRFLTVVGPNLTPSLT